MELKIYNVHNSNIMGRTMPSGQINRNLPDKCWDLTEVQQGSFVRILLSDRSSFKGGYENETFEKNASIGDGDLLGTRVDTR